MSQNCCDGFLIIMRKQMKKTIRIGILSMVVASVWIACDQTQSSEELSASSTKENEEEATKKIHETTGLIDAPGLNMVIANCTACHSAELIRQNRASREGWLAMIRWMQETQNLWDLGVNEEAILDYLEKNYSPEKEGRRRNLANIEWYELKEP